MEAPTDGPESRPAASASLADVFAFENLEGRSALLSTGVLGMPNELFATFALKLGARTTR